MLETENPGELEAFRVEIQGIIDALKVSDGTIKDVKTDIDVKAKDLDLEDARLWEKFKESLRIAAQLDTSGKITKAKVDKLMQELKDLLVFVTQNRAESSRIVADVATKKSANVSKGQFNAWLENRSLYIFSMLTQITHDRGRDTGKGKGKLRHEGFINQINLLKGFAARKVEYYINGGWKNQETQS